MAGGTWTTQNKDRPGVYINTESSGGSQGAAGDRGVVSLALPLSWGAPKVMTTVEAGVDTLPLLGYDLTAPELLLVRESLKRAKTLLLYRLNEGVKASVTIGSLTVTAKHGGVRGNDIAVVIESNIDNPGAFDVKTLLKGSVMHTQSAATIAALKSDEWVTFAGTGALTATAGAPLLGGTDSAATNGDHSNYLAALELHDFQTVALASTDNALKAVYAAFIRRLREDEGKKVQAVVENYTVADYDGVLSVKNGVILSDGTALTAMQATAWVAAATAAAEMNESLTYQSYDDAVDVSPRYSNSQIIAALQAGEFLFTPSAGRAVVEQDINTFRSFTPLKGRERSKNRVIRVLDGIANDLKRIFETSYIGKVDNNADGRALFRKEVAGYLNTLQEIGAVQNFDAQADISVLAGQASDAIFVEARVQPVDSIEKIYMRVKVV